MLIWLFYKLKLHGFSPDCSRRLQSVWLNLWGRCFFSKSRKLLIASLTLFGGCDTLNVDKLLRKFLFLTSGSFSLFGASFGGLKVLCGDSETFSRYLVLYPRLVLVYNSYVDAFVLFPYPHVSSDMFEYVSDNIAADDALLGRISRLGTCWMEKNFFDQNKF